VLTGARGLLLEAAERVMAERGLDVPLKDIALEAGQRNNSAVPYHFGSREGLIRAVIELRTAPQEARRMELLADLERTGGTADVELLVGMLVRPACELPYAAGATHWARFVEQVRNRPLLADVEFAPDLFPTGQIAASKLAQQLGELPVEVRRRRIETVIGVQFSMLADLERRWDGTGSPAPSAEVVDDLVRMLVGMLQAPIS
jgi:AcrR family transcriptional regulator